MLAQADIQYSQLTTAAWGNAGDIITYDYDANGSMTHKTTIDSSTGYTTETVVYDYNLQNRLKQVTTTPYVDNVAQTPEVVEYKYNPQGMRIGKDVDGTTTDYLIDPYNHTGYAQVLQETVDDGGSDWTRINYTLGDDVIAQTHLTSSNAGVDWTTGDTQYLLYDGHGSTRQLAYWTGTGSEIGITDTYSYDGYGVLLQDETVASGNPGYTPQQATNLLYSGEQFDANAQQYYLRARYYNPLNGVFNRVDPYAGNTQDPQSLHKYAYVHNNPVNGIDPSGMMGTIAGVVTVSAISGALSSIMMGAYGMAKQWSARKIASAMGKAFLLGFGVGLFAGAAAAGLAAGAVAAGATAATGYTAAGIMFGHVSLATAISNVIYASKHGDSVDQTFAKIDLGMAVGGLILSHYAAFSVGYKGGPISRAAMAQQKGDYVPDTGWADMTVHRDSLLYASTPEQTGGRVPNFFTTADTLVGSNLDKTTIWSRLQTKSIRDKIGIYQIIDDADGAFSVTGANTDFGSGGFPQIFLKNPQKSVRQVGEIQLH